MSPMQEKRLNKLSSNHTVRILRFENGVVTAVINSSPVHNEFSIYTLLSNGESVDFVWFNSRAYKENFKALPTLNTFRRSLA